MLKFQHTLYNLKRLERDMPRKPRIEIPGFYHLVNRGVAQCVVFKEAGDYAYFEELLCFGIDSFGMVLHNYCLMSNHYHLLVEIKEA